MDVGSLGKEKMAAELTTKQKWAFMQLHAARVSDPKQKKNAEWYATSLLDKPSYNVTRHLFVCLTSEPFEWLEAFGQAHGHVLLLSQLSALQQEQSVNDEKRQILLLVTLQAVMALLLTRVGRTLLLTAGCDTFKRLVLCLDPQCANHRCREFLFDHLAFLSHSWVECYSKVLEAMEYYKYATREPTLFFHLVLTLKTDSMVAVKVACLRFINCLIETPDNLDDRMKVRRTFDGLQLKRIVLSEFEMLKDDEPFATEVDILLQDELADEQHMASLVSKLTEQVTIPDSAVYAHLSEEKPHLVSEERRLTSRSSNGGAKSESIVDAPLFSKKTIWSSLQGETSKWKQALDLEHVDLSSHDSRLASQKQAVVPSRLLAAEVFLRSTGLSADEVVHCVVNMEFSRLPDGWIQLIQGVYPTDAELEALKKEQHLQVAELFLLKLSQSPYLPERLSVYEAAEDLARMGSECYKRVRILMDAAETLKESQEWRELLAALLALIKFGGEERHHNDSASVLSVTKLLQMWGEKPESLQLHWITSLGKSAPDLLETVTTQLSGKVFLAASVSWKAVQEDMRRVRQMLENVQKNVSVVQDDTFHAKFDSKWVERLTKGTAAVSSKVSVCQTMLSDLRDAYAEEWTDPQRFFHVLSTFLTRLGSSMKMKNKYRESSSDARDATVTQPPGTEACWKPETQILMNSIKQGKLALMRRAERSKPEQQHHGSPKLE